MWVGPLFDDPDRLHIYIYIYSQKNVNILAIQIDKGVFGFPLAVNLDVIDS